MLTVAKTAVLFDEILQAKAQFGKYLMEKCLSKMANNSPLNVLKNHYLLSKVSKTQRTISVGTLKHLNGRSITCISYTQDTPFHSFTIYNYAGIS